MSAAKAGAGQAMKDAGRPDPYTLRLVFDEPVKGKGEISEQNSATDRAPIDARRHVARAAIQGGSDGEISRQWRWGRS